MSEKDKLPPPADPDSTTQSFSARESWRIFGIMAEFVEATERLAAIRPAVSVFETMISLVPKVRSTPVKWMLLAMSPGP